MYKSPLKIGLLLLLLLIAGCSNFYVKIVDQYGEPVSGVEMEIGRLNNFFLVSSGSSSYETSNWWGRFNAGSSRAGIHYIQKSGYEFSGGKGYGSRYILGNANQDNSFTNPYIIVAWKRDKPENLVGSMHGRSSKLFPDNQFYGIDMTHDNFRPIVVESSDVDSSDFDLLVRLNKTMDESSTEVGTWKTKKFTLMVPNGGLIETSDIFRNVAPVDGYKKKWEWEVTVVKNKYLYSNYQTKFYLKSRGGQVYGQFQLDISPDNEVLNFTGYWLNPNGSRNLTRPKKYVYCLQHTPESCNLDDFEP